MLLPEHIGAAYVRLAHQRGFQLGLKCIAWRVYSLRALQESRVYMVYSLRALQEGMVYSLLALQEERVCSLRALQ